MFASFDQFCDIFDIDVSIHRERNDIYSVDEHLSEYVDLSHHRCVHAGFYLGEEKDTFKPSFGALSLIERRPIKVDREGAWWFTNGKKVPAEYIRPPVTADTPTIVMYKQMILGLGDIEKGQLVPLRDVGWFLREGA